MANLRADLTLSEVYISEEKKNQPDYLKGMADYWIGRLIVEKDHIPICRKYYSGSRDKEEYQYLTDNYGIGNAIDIQFTPIIKPRIDALVGLFLSESFSYRITTTDSKTIDLEMEARKNHTISEISNRLIGKAEEIRSFFQNRDQNVKSTPPGDVLTKEYLNGLREYMDKEFTSIYVEAAQNLVGYFENSNTLNLRRKFADLLYDLLITGEMFWRQTVEEQGSDPILSVVKPENIFFNKNKNDLFLDSADAVVHREYMTRHQVIQKYGHLMSHADTMKITGRYGGSNSKRRMVDPEILQTNYNEDNEFSTNRQFTGNQLDVIEVHHVEWLASSEYNKSLTQKRNPVERKKALSKKGWIEHRYEVTRILGDIYVGMGKSKNVIRTQNDPYKASLSYNGISYNLRNGTPYSMVYSLKDVQDMYDITQFHRNNLVANAGVAGTRVNIAAIPKVLGGKFMDRLMKWTALRKQGMELIDPTEEGAQLFNHYGEFPGGIDGNTIQGINAILETLQRQVVLSTGITDQMLGQIEEREAVENVKTGIRQVSLITLNIFDLMDNARKRVLTDLIDLSKISYKTGKKGAYKVGTSYVAFNINPDNFTWTDYNIQVTNSSKDVLKLQKLSAIIQELIGAGLVKPETAINLTLADSVEEAKSVISKGMLSDQEQEQQMKQMQEQLAEYEDQVQRQSKQAAELERQSARYSEEQLRIDRDKLTLEREVKGKELDIKDREQRSRQYKDEEEVKARRAIVQLEREQLYVEGSNNQAKEVNNNKF